MEKKFAIIVDSQGCDSEHMMQILTKARSLGSRCITDIWVLCVGDWNDSKLEPLFRYGADHIKICRQEEPFDIPYLTDAVADMVLEVNPNVLLVPAIENGKAVASSLSSRFEAGLISNVIDMDLDVNGELYFLSSDIYDSNIAKVKGNNCSMIICTIAKDQFEKEESNRESKGTISTFTYHGRKERLSHSWKIQERQRKEEKKVNAFQNDKKVLCIGRGVKNRDIFARICKVAEECGAGIVGTRPAAEAGFIEHDRLVGQSGKRLSSQIYVSLGVSGANQHVAGIKNAEIIIAVNSDEHAPIFDYADYCIVDQVENILEELEQIIETKADKLVQV